MALNPLHSTNLFDLTGCIAVVTGGGTGLGLMMAKALEANGAKVYIIGRRFEVLQAAAKQAKFNNIHPLQGSITSHTELQSAVDHINTQDGYINLLINNAGISTPNLGPHNTRPTPKWDIVKVRDYWFQKSFEDYAAVFETNTTAALMVTFAFLELLDKGNKVRAAGAGSPGALTNGNGIANGGTSRPYIRSQVITVSSVGGLGRDNSAFIYGASKAGTTHMMKNLATYLAPWRIRVNIAAPGYFDTDMMAGFCKATHGRLPMAMAPEERFGDSQEIGGTIVYLASKAGAYCNGLVLLVDGGYVSNKPSSY
ncbi:Gluconate 5-dehydrogenase [Penicillium rolfsii]|nr:Gluconate 5-dehydrogenase [Penicillium rolfsii]